jgi:hypothetical protein
MKKWMKLTQLVGAQCARRLTKVAARRYATRKALWRRDWQQGPLPVAGWTLPMFDLPSVVGLHLQVLLC